MKDSHTRGLIFTSDALTTELSGALNTKAKTFYPLDLF